MRIIGSQISESLIRGSDCIMKNKCASCWVLGCASFLPAEACWRRASCSAGSNCCLGSPSAIPSGTSDSPSKKAQTKGGRDK